MSDDNGISSPGGKWLLQAWLEKLTGVIQGMTDQRPTGEWSSSTQVQLADGALILEQGIGSVAEPVIWLGVPESVHQDLGGRVLLAAGLDTAEADEKRSTCLEMIEQSLGGLTGAITKKVGRDVRREAAMPCDSFPTGLSAAQVVLTIGDARLEPIFIAFAPELISWFAEKPTVASASKPADVKEDDSAAEVVVGSRVFELLLDVALPVSVSFGRAEVPVKEVLKLTTGSIVELNRSISEPVDIIVNGCTIARGEVVVVEGNYGVRIQNIISRKERLRTGAAAAEARTK